MSVVVGVKENGGVAKDTSDKKKTTKKGKK